MHRALEIQEILLDIFGHCSGYLPTSSDKHTSDLLALARTCRAFKEPALDVLWADLPDPSPLARCLPEASHRLDLGPGAPVVTKYAFTRSPTIVEWNILRSYAHRIRSIQQLSPGLTWESVEIFLNPPTTDPLFPNLRHLNCGFVSESMRFLFNTPFPSLLSLRVAALRKSNLHVLQDILESVFNLSTNLRRLSVNSEQPDITFSNFFSSYICQWKNLQTVRCGSVVLDMDALVHLSHMPALAQLTFTASSSLLVQISPSEPLLFFSNLEDLSLRSELLESISQFLTRTRLPAIMGLSASIERRPSKQAVSSFLASLQTCVISRTIHKLSLVHTGLADSEEHGWPVLELQDVEPCTVFSYLRCIHINLDWDVHLMNDDLLALASAWPHLEQFFINEDRGWRTPGGITPDGVRRLLETCQSLREIALAIDTRGCTEVMASPPSEWTRRLPPGGSIDVLDSTLEEDAVPAMATFLASIASQSEFSFWACRSWFLPATDSTVRWYDAYRRASDTLSQHCLT